MQRNLERTVEEKPDQHELAEYLGVSTRTVRTLIKRGELLPPIRIGRKQIWLRVKFMRWLEDGQAVSIQVQPTTRSGVLGVPRENKFVGLIALGSRGERISGLQLTWCAPFCARSFANGSF